MTTESISIDNERLIIHATLPRESVVLHVLLDKGMVCPPDPDLHLRAFIRYFPAMSRECQLRLEMSAHHCDIALKRRTIRSVAIVASGHGAIFWMQRWRDYLHRWGTLFARRDPETVLFTPLLLPFEQNDLPYFPHRGQTNQPFEITSFAKIASAPFTLIEHGSFTTLACHAVNDVGLVQQQTG